MWNKIAGVIHHVNRSLAVYDADVHVETEDEIRTRHQLHVLDDIFVAIVGINLLHSPVGEGVGGGSSDTKAVFAAEADDFAAEFLELVLGFFDVGADRGTDFDDRLMHLRLDALLECDLAFFNDLGVDVGAQIPGLGIDSLVFLLNSERERRLHGPTLKGRPPRNSRRAICY